MGERYLLDTHVLLWLLVAQATLEELVLVTVDRAITSLAAARVLTW